jgi:hypothetical protein
MPDIEAERYARTGSIAANGIQRLLGMPDLDRLETAIREAVQNSWDARLYGQTPHFRIRLRSLTADQQHVLHQRFFAQSLPAEAPDGKHFTDALTRLPVRVLELADYGTCGLGGPVSPEELPESGEPTDFVDFLRNIGSPRDMRLGGGTYGYGKSSFYALSSCRTVVVDTVCHWRGSAQRRLMGCHIGERYDIASGQGVGRYTGRHWWGNRMDDGALGPLEGRKAEQLAVAMGLPDRGDISTGTTIMVIDPAISCDRTEETPCDIRLTGDPATRIIGVLLASFWPKLIPLADGSLPMTFSIETDGAECQVPDPADIPPFHLYAQALKAVRGGSSENRALLTEIHSGRPRKFLGRLAICRDVVLSHASMPRQGYQPFGAPAHHVALMRSAELVVKYMRGEPVPDDRVEWAGVFVSDTDAEVDRAFAASEPPAHDDWNPAHLEPRSRAKTFVTVALRRIKEHAAQQSAPTHPLDGKSRVPSIAALADRFGGALLGLPGTRLGGNSNQSRRRRPGSGRRRSKSQVSFVGLEEHQHQPCARFAIRLSARPNSIGIRGIAEVLLENREPVETAPNGRCPRIVHWESAGGDVLATGSTLKPPPGASKVYALVLIPDYVAVRLRIAEEQQSND